MRATSSSGLGWVLVVVPVERFWEAVRRSICPLISRQHELDISVLRVLGAVLRLCPAASVTGSTSFCSGGGGALPDNFLFRAETLDFASAQRGVSRNLQRGGGGGGGGWVVWNGAC